MIAPEPNDGKGLDAISSFTPPITDLLMKSYCCLISDRAPPRQDVWWWQLPLARSR